MILMSSPEYENKVRYQLSQSGTRLAFPTNISTNIHTVNFGAVENANSYSFYLDHTLFATVPLIGTGVFTYLFNELVTIPDNELIEYSISFTSNGTTYSAIKIYGRDIAPNATNKYAIYYDNTLVFEENATSASMWAEQAYRTIVFATSPSTIAAFLALNAIEQPEQLSVDLSTLTGWSDISDGIHALQLVARGSGYRSSFLSEAINLGKNIDFITGVIYGPYQVNRVIDGDTVEMLINGSLMKVRMIGVNTPESVAKSGYKTENCQEGIDASNYTKSRLTGQNLYIEFDIDHYDRYNRYLCYLYWDAQGANMYNAELIAQGYGEAQYYSPNGAHKTFLEQTQATARANDIGFWGTGFFPTKLEPPVVALNGTVISWPYNAYTESYNIKKNGTVVHNFVQPVGGLQNEFDLTNLGLPASTYRINVVSVPTNTTHEGSNNSNNITYTVV